MEINHYELLQKISKVGVTYKQVNKKIKSQLVECAVIKFNSDQSDIFLARVLKKRRFSHIDYLDHVQGDTVFSFGATCIDEKLHSVFGVSATLRNMVLVPQHNTNLESFVDYYLMVRETIDPKAELMTFSDYEKQRKVIQ